MVRLVPRRVVFVCTGNTCRSPLAEVIARQVLDLAGLGLVEVTSAGLQAVPGQAAAPQAVKVAAALGLDLGAHRARALADVPVDERTLVLAMTPEQAAAARRRLPAGVPVEALLPYARRLGADVGAEEAIADPLHLGQEAYERVARTLRGALRAVAAAWAAEFAGPDGTAGVQTKSLALPRLSGLHPTLESTALKLLEEAGELAETIGKYRALSGERRVHPLSEREVMAAVGGELLDVAQTAVTMMFVLEEQYGLDLPALLGRHIRKLAEKGYLDPVGTG